MLQQFQAEIMQPAFWLSFGKIVWIDVFLSGDNALVIAMVCRGLEPRQRALGMILGAGAAVLMRVALTGVATEVMGLPYIKLVGGAALLVIAIKLLAPPKGEGSDLKQASGLWSAIGIVMMADATMSIDNVIAVAAAANGSLILLCLGLALSIPLIVAGASLIVTVLDRLPVLIWAGAALLGWIAGEVMAEDHAISPISLGLNPLACAAAGSLLVLVIGSLWRSEFLTSAKGEA